MKFENKASQQSSVIFIAILTLLTLAGCAEPTPPPATPTAEAVVPVTLRQPTPPANTLPEESWLRLPDLPDDATQAEIGAEVYRLVCSTCHGGQGQGLTPEWRATLDVGTQNCWQSKCHASTYPVEGFELPRYVPPLHNNPEIPLRFATAADLYTFISTKMPYQAPGSLTKTEYWQLAAFILEINAYSLDSVVLNPETAPTFKLE